MVTYAKPALLAVKTDVQNLLAGATVAYDTNYIGPSATIAHAPGSGVVTITGAGLYSVTFNADITATITGPITVDIYNNGVIIPGAQTTFEATLAEPVHITLNTLIKVMKSCACADNTQNLQVKVSAAVGVINASIMVIKEA